MRRSPGSTVTYPRSTALPTGGCSPVSGRGRAVKGEDELIEPKYEAMVADRESRV